MPFQPVNNNQESHAMITMYEFLSGEFDTLIHLYLNLKFMKFYDFSGLQDNCAMITASSDS